MTRVGGLQRRIHAAEPTRKKARKTVQENGNERTIDAKAFCGFPNSIRIELSWADIKQWMAAQRDLSAKGAAETLLAEA